MQSPWLSLQQRCQVGSKVGDDAIEEAMVADVVATGPITLSVPTGRCDGKLMEVRRLCGKVNHVPFLLPFNQDPVANPLIPITLTIRDSILTNVTSYCNFHSACMCSTQPSSPVWVPHLRRLHIRKQHTRICQQSIVLGDRQYHELSKCEALKIQNTLPKGTREPLSKSILDLILSCTTRQEAAIWCSPALESASKITWQWCCWRPSNFPMSLPFTA